MKARFLALAALVLGLASCQTEPEGLDVNVGGEVDTFVTVSLPETTRANSTLGAFDNVVNSNEYTIRYILQVFYNSEESGADRQVIYSDGKTVNFPVRLVPGREYSFVAWADVVRQDGKTLDELTSVEDTTLADLHYNTSDLKNITLKNETWVAMDETRDAFTDVETLEYYGNSTISLELIRPFAKLRVVTTDMVELGHFNIDPAYATVDYKTEYRPGFNALAGKALGAGSEKKTHLKFRIEDYADFVGTAYEDTNKVLFTDYFFAEAGDAVSFVLNVFEDEQMQKPIKSNDFSTDIAVNRNYLTTISGNILTDGNKIEVEVKDAFENVNDNGNTTDPNYEYKTISSDNEFLAALTTPGKYVVISDLHVAKAGDTITTLATRAGDATTTIDLNGKTITVENKGTGALASVAAGNTLVITNTVDGGKIELTEGSTGAFIKNNGTVVIENGNIKSNSTNNAPVIDNNGTTNITGGVIGDNAVENTENGDVNITGGKLEGDDFDDFIDDDYTKNENNEIVMKPTIAKIGEVGYTSLQKAVAAVQDGETITLVANETFTEKNYYDNGGWKDGLGYAGDKSFTIDLGNFTISQNGALNDYLIWVKNVGSKANTITIKNGTLDAGTTAYCALCTASSHDNQLTINLENITLINNISNGSTVKVRAGSVVNVKAGTKIIGKDSYLGIENWKATVNIYDGAEIYMNGTTSYNGCLVGVGGNGTINVYGGYGKGVKGGFIAMTSGGTINVAGGEWIANTNGSIGNNSNLYVLTAQSNKYEQGFAGPSIINVTGGTLRGGMDAWVLNNLEGEKAELNISGGNFNANPTNFLAEGCEANETNGIWTVSYNPYYDYEKVANGLYKKDKTYVAINGDGLVALSGMTIKGGEIVTLGADIDLTDVEFNGLNAFNSENNNTFDGQNFTVSNWTNNSKASDMGFFKGWVGTIKNVNFENCHLQTSGRSAIVAANTYCNIDKVNVNNCSIEDSYWACGIIAGLYNSGSISNCTVTNSSVKSNGGTAAIVGVFNESAGERGLKNCSVSNTTINNTGAYGEAYSGGALVGMFNSGATFTIEGCTVSNNTLVGGYVYEKYPADESVTIIEK